MFGNVSPNDVSIHELLDVSILMLGGKSQHFLLFIAVVILAAGNVCEKSIVRNTSSSLGQWKWKQIETPSIGEKHIYL